MSKLFSRRKSANYQPSLLIAARKLIRSIFLAQGQLSIRSTFTVVTAINGLVLGYLLVVSLQALLAGRGGNADQYVLFGLTLLLSLLAMLSFVIIDRRVVRPLAWLSKQARRIEKSDEGELLKISGDDELTRLVHGFNLVLTNMRSAYAELDNINSRLLEANQQIADSIRYAGILQRSILPDQQLDKVFGPDHFVLWKPKDIVGGDYYLMHSETNRCLIGVADCAGHGVTGAMMAMMTRAEIDRSIQDIGIASPAAILSCTDLTMRNILLIKSQSKSIATSMDMGLVLIDFEKRTVRFAGARIALYWYDGQEINCVSGASRALCDRRHGSYKDYDLALLPGFTYYLTTDGFLDQSGGEHGFSIGDDRYRAWLTEHAAKPMQQQLQSLTNALSTFQGSYPQRDDITLLALRFN